MRSSSKAFASFSAPTPRTSGSWSSTSNGRRVDVTLLDTNGETQDVEQRVADLVADPAAGAVVVFSFSDQQRLVRRVLKAGAIGFISKAVSATDIVDASVQ